MSRSSVETLLIYVDDVIVYASSPEQMLARLDEVFKRLRGAGLKLKCSKCQLFQRRVAFLGHVITEDGVSPDPEKVRVVRDWRQPKCVSDVHSFIGLCSYYRRYIQAFSACTRPLFQLLEAEQPFQWTEECEQAFLDLKTALVGDEMLALQLECIQEYQHQLCQTLHQDLERVFQHLAELKKTGGTPPPVSLVWTMAALAMNLSSYTSRQFMSIRIAR